mgnify:CR=1 FL=1
MGGRRRGRSNRAYGVVVTFLPHKGGAVPESERRRAAWRITEPSHTCSWLLLRCPISSSLSHLGGAGVGGAAGAGARYGAVRAIVCLASCRVCLRLYLLTTKSSSKEYTGDTELADSRQTARRLALDRSVPEAARSKH